jgi:hypothetical protein
MNKDSKDLYEGTNLTQLDSRPDKHELDDDNKSVRVPHLTQST